MDKRLEGIERLRRNHMLRLLRKTQRRVRPSPGGRLLRISLSVLFMGGLLWVHSRFGEIGVVVLALLVLLGLSHPLWLLLPRWPRGQSAPPIANGKPSSTAGEPSTRHALGLTGRDGRAVPPQSVWAARFKQE
jgi:hypothetical protein